MVGRFKATFLVTLSLLLSVSSRPIMAHTASEKLLTEEKSESLSSAPRLAQNSDTYAKAKEELDSTWYAMYRITEKMIRANGLDSNPWRVAFIPDNRINAFATDVNFIGFYSGLVDQIHGDTSALACVIGHEIAHHTQRHIPTRLAKSAAEVEELEKSLNKAKRRERFGRGLGRGTVVGIVGSLIRGNARSRQARMVREFNEKQIARSHNNEFEADEYGFLMMARAGFDPQGCIRLLEVISKTPLGDVDGKTHPSSASRLERMNELIANNSLSELKNEGQRKLDANPKPLTYGRSADAESLRINSKFGGEWEF